VFYRWCGSPHLTRPRAVTRLHQLSSFPDESSRHPVVRVQQEETSPGSENPPDSLRLDHLVLNPVPVLS
jgi:5-methylcytosine-specific restriction endonuclease McrA